jgi:hypothetical protein
MGDNRTGTEETTADARDPSMDDAIGVWYDLEQAFAGKNGFGGSVAEIYAYRLVPGGVKAFPGPASKTPELAILAGQNLTRLLKRFSDVRRAHVAIEERHGFRTLDLGCEEIPPFDWRIHLCITPIVPVSPPAPPIHEMRKVIEQTGGHLRTMLAMLDELGAHRAKQRLGAEGPSAVDTDDLPPDGPTGLYLDAPFGKDDLEWIKMAWDAFLAHGDVGGANRASQLMLVFQAIRRDDRATAEFLRVMNTIVLPFLRRLRLRDQPQLVNLGAANE